LFATQKNRLKGLNSNQYTILQDLCRYAKNLYNVALYNLRQHFFATGKLLSYAKNCAQCKSNENFALLQAGVAQQIIRTVTQSFKSFLALRIKAGKGEYPREKVRIPRYLKKDSYFMLVLSTNAISFKDGRLSLPLSNTFKKENPLAREAKEMSFSIPERIDHKLIREVHIHPAHNAYFFEVEFIYRNQPVAASELDTSRILGIDPGVDNLAACAATTGHTFLVDGRPLKAANQWYNKERSRLQAIKDNHGIKVQTRKMAAVAMNRDYFVMDYMRKSARYIINFCIANHIGTVVVGVNKEQKQLVNIGHINNQNFVQIPFWKLRRILQSLCERYGILYFEAEESYTSKASFLDKDSLPEYDPGFQGKHGFSGRRIKRGLYRTKGGCIIHADINGAANIIRKFRPDADFSALDKAVLLNPKRVRVLRTVRRKPADKKSKAAA